MKIKLLFFIGLALNIANYSFPQSFQKITDSNNPIVSDPPSAAGAFNGCAWIDFDNDGKLDLYVVGKNDIYKNMGGGNFSKISNAIQGNFSSVYGTTWADYDNDGFIDCYLSGGNAPGSFLYRNNNGNGTFTLITAGQIGNSSVNKGWGCAFGDYNNDGRPDLVIAAAFNFSGINNPNILFLNTGSGNFTKVDSSVITTGTAPYTVPTWYDYDDDGDIDLFIGSGPATGSLAPDYLYKNLFIETGNPYFAKITSAPLATDNADGQVWNWIDYDNDGDLDAFRTNYNGTIPNDLYKNNGSGNFTKMTSAQVGPIVSDLASSIANVWGDFDNDGWLDCFVGNAGNSLGFYYRNNGNGTFTKLTSIAIATDLGSRFGIAAADYDLDGKLDIFTSGTANVKALFRNTTANSNAFINLKCTGGVSGKSALGTKIKIKANINGTPMWQRAEINAQNSFCSMNMLNSHFGLGNATVIDSLIIRWISGTTQVFTNVDANRFYRLVEGGSLEPVSVKNTSTEVPERFALHQNFPNPFNPETTITFDVPKNLTHDKINLSVYDMLGKKVAGLFHGSLAAGSYEAKWNAINMPSGIYFYTLQSGDFKITKKMMLVK